MRTAHFVYAGDPGNQLRHAPFTITRRVYEALLPLFDRVCYYDWCHCGPFEPVGPDDVIIGHPNYPHNTATRQLFNRDCRAKILIFPFHHGMPDINFPFDDLVRKADAVLSITGQYWYDTIGQTKFAHWKDKITRVDMAVDETQFPLVKTSFNPPGKRAFFYIGADRPEKGLGTLYDIFSGTNHVLHLYGMIDGGHPTALLPNTVLHGWADTSPGFAADLATIADCCVHGGVSDANPTTLLESACWGFPVACTPTSGYWPDRPFYGINPGDIAGSKALLDYIQTIPESVLVLRARQMRDDVRTNYTWDKFVGTVTDVVKRFL